MRLIHWRENSRREAALYRRQMDDALPTSLPSSRHGSEGDMEKDGPTETATPVAPSIGSDHVDKEGHHGLTTTISRARRQDEEQIEYPKAMKLALIMIALCLSVFLMALDNTIISTAIPKITDQFHSINDVGWYASSYLLTTCAFQLFFGKLYTFYSIKWVYLTAIGIFEIGSAVCGAAPNSTALIIGRAVVSIGTQRRVIEADVKVGWTWLCWYFRRSYSDPLNCRAPREASIVYGCCWRHVRHRVRRWSFDGRW